MNKDYDLYIFSLNILQNCLDSIRKCNSNLPSEMRIYNAKIIDDIYDKIYLLKNDNFKVENDDLDNVTKKLVNIIKNESEKIYLISNSVTEIFDSKKKEKKFIIDIVKKECNKLLNMISEISNMLHGIIFDNSSNKNKFVSNIIKNKIYEEEKQIELISRETNYISEYTFEDLIYKNKLTDYCNFICTKIFKSKNMIHDIINVKKENKKQLSSSEEISLSLLQEIVEEQLKILNDSYEKFIEILNSFSSNITKENDKIQEYSRKVINLLNELYVNKSDSEVIVKRLKDLYDSEHETPRKSNYQYNEKLQSTLIVDEEQKKKDTQKYKDDYSMLNKSFWESRHKASLEGIKYPSVLYEKKVKEYQNNYLIDNYNVSLEALEQSIEDYKTKYASDIYMDEVYEESMNQLKEETLATTDEICDESYGLSLLDKRAYIILNDNLTEIIKELALAKKEENLDTFIDLSEYRKSVRISALMEKKELIEQQMYIIEQRRNKLEELI